MAPHTPPPRPRAPSPVQQIPPCCWLRARSRLNPLSGRSGGEISSHSSPTPPLLPGPYQQQPQLPICSPLFSSLSSPPPCLLLPWEELFLGAASWDVLLGAGYHEGNVTKTVGKGCRHQEPCRGHRELCGCDPVLALESGQSVPRQSLAFLGLASDPMGIFWSKLVELWGISWRLSPFPP